MNQNDILDDALGGTMIDWRSTYMQAWKERTEYRQALKDIYSLYKAREAECLDSIGEIAGLTLAAYPEEKP